MARSVNPNTGIKGMDIVLSNLTKAINGIKRRSVVGLLEAATEILNDTDKTPPLIPIDTTNLRASRFITPMKIGGKPVVLFGFEANYALFVHEMVDRGNGINWSRPGSGPKFLEASLNRNKARALQIIADNLKF